MMANSIGLRNQKKHRPAPFAQRLFADLTAIATPLFIMNRNGAHSCFASCRTRQIRAELVGRVHWLCSECLHTRQYAYRRSFFLDLLTFHRLEWLYPGRRAACKMKQRDNASNSFGYKADRTPLSGGE